MTLSAILKDYLDRVEQEGSEVQFGRERPSKEPTASRILASEKAALTRSLERKATFNDRVLLSIVVSYLLLLAVATTLVVVHQNDVRWISGFLGGNFLSLIVVMIRLQSIWREKNVIDMMVAILPSLTASESLKLIQGVYIHGANRGGGVAAGTAGRRTSRRQPGTASSE